MTVDGTFQDSISKRTSLFPKDHTVQAMSRLLSLCQTGFQEREGWLGATVRSFLLAYILFPVCHTYYAIRRPSVVQWLQFWTRL